MLCARHWLHCFILINSMNLCLMNEKTVAQSINAPSLYIVILSNSVLNEWMDKWIDGWIDG